MYRSRMSRNAGYADEILEGWAVWQIRQSGGALGFSPESCKPKSGSGGVAKAIVPVMGDVGCPEHRADGVLAEMAAGAAASRAALLAGLVEVVVAASSPNEQGAVPHGVVRRVLARAEDGQFAALLRCYYLARGRATAAELVSLGPQHWAAVCGLDAAQWEWMLSAALLRFWDLYRWGVVPQKAARADMLAQA